MRPPKHSWPDTAGSRNILFFAQVLSEMLSAATFESFRVYSLDTIARLEEALFLIGDVRRGRIPQISLTPIIEELEWSFNKDSAAKFSATDEITSLLKYVKDKKSISLDFLDAHLKLIRNLTTENYKNILENLILEKISDPDQKIELRKLCGFYCSHIVNIGYDKTYIANLVDEFFLKNPIQRIGKLTLARFFRKFDGKRKKFTVHAAVAHDIGVYLRGLGFHVRSIPTLTNEQAASLRSNLNHANTPQALETSTEQFDPFGAANFVYQSLSSQRAIAYLDPRGMHCEWGDTMHVTLARAKTGTRIERSTLSVYNTATTPARSGASLKSISNYAKYINSSFDATSTERLISSINTAALARTSPNPENQLISFWSAIEVLLSDPQDGPRIAHYEKLIVPCIAFRHARRQAYAIYQALLLHYRKRFRNLVASVATDSLGGSFKTFAYAMFLREHSEWRNELCTMLARNPLALHRVWKLNSDYKNHKNIFHALSDHDRRVSWQIHRIYRSRNQLVHSGRMPSYLESLILNLAEYYRSATATIIRRATAEPNKSDIDQIVYEIGIRYGIYKNYFENQSQNQDFSEKDINILFDITP
ncbi:hypothetical protein GAS19_11540 [Burkholderia glumae]|uniref:hypothetical protein n=1 Tax=Burkholderia glumae TaxID=337 RepID=UPI0012955A38|nr:hypothetical protein [Burkholderia glumae]QGA38185.1 hypothetical protein GAS19_11540 [Burkholderia glumae]